MGAVSKVRLNLWKVFLKILNGVMCRQEVIKFLLWQTWK
nr:MAG TPA: hypothetical protein [Caudoviricetes sp.]